MSIKEKDLRAAIVAQSAAMEMAGLNVGTSGNISVRMGETMLITPTSVPYNLMTPAMIAAMPINGEYGSWSGPLTPSTEWRFHLDILRARPDVGAIAHFHSPFCCALAMLNKPILAAHYMIAFFGGPIVKCAKYAPFGTKELADLVVDGTWRPQRGAARQSRRADDRARFGCSRLSCATTRKSGADILLRDYGGAPGDPFRRRDGAHHRALQGLRRRRRGAQNRGGAEEALATQG